MTPGASAASDQPKAVADYAQQKQVVFVNHTFTTHCALAASLAPFAGIPGGGDL